MKKNTCCKTCEIRHQGCHSTCETYKAWIADIHAEKQARIRSLSVDSFRAECVVKARKRNKKKYGMPKGDA